MTEFSYLAAVVVRDVLRTRLEQRDFAAWERLGPEEAEDETPSERYARLRFIPDPRRPGQVEADAVKSGPSEREQLCAGLAVLGEHTETPDDCFFCIWDGWGTAFDAPSRIRRRCKRADARSRNSARSRVAFVMWTTACGNCCNTTGSAPRWSWCACVMRTWST